MKKFGYVLIGLLVVLIGGGLVAPSFINWNQYKGEIQTLVKEATGRQIHIDGDISVSLLPSPALQVDNVRLVNVAGASSENMVTLRSAIVHVAFGPLLGGVVQVESFKLVEPVVEVEVFADGKNNLVFTPPPKEAGSEQTQAQNAAPQPSGDIDENAMPVQVDSFVIENGLVIYRDGASGKVEHISGLNAEIAAGSLIGPFDMSGGFVRGGLPLNFEVSIGKIIHERTVGFATNLDAGGQGKVNLKGTLITTPDGPKAKGSFKAEGENLAKLIGYISGGGKLPGMLGQAFSAEGKLSADKGSAKLEGGRIRLGTTQGEVSFDVAFAKEVDAVLKLKFKHADANKWLEMKPVMTEGAKLPETVATVEKKGGTSKASLALQPNLKKETVTEKADKPFALPKGINVSLDVSADTVVFMDDAVRDAKLSASLAGGEITLNQISAGLPGGTDIAAFGFVSVANNQPKFEGNLEATASDLRGMLRWLRVDVPHIPADRLRKMVVTADVGATAEQLQLTNVKAAFDSSKINGGVVVALRERPSFGADFTLDRLNLDAYMPRSSSPAQPAKAPSAETTEKDGKSDAKTTEQEAINPFKPLAVLTSFDANLKLRVKALTVQGQPANNARIDATLFKGNLTLRDVGVDNFAGVSVKVGGELGKLEGIPVAKDISAQVSASNTASLFKFTGIVPPVDPNKLGAVSVQANVDGSLLTPTFATKVNAAGGEVNLSGKANPMSWLTGLKVKGAIRHNNLAQLMDRLGLGGNPSAKTGGIDLTATIEGNAKKVTVTDIQGQLAGASVKGDVAADLSGAKPSINAKFDLGHIAAHWLMPVKTSKAKPTSQKATKSSRYSKWEPGGKTSTDASESRWSTAPLDLSGLNQVNADVVVNAQSLTYDKFKIMNAQLAAVLKDGVLNISQLTGGLFKGKLEGKAQLSAVAKPAFSSSLSLKGGGYPNGGTCCDRERYG